MQPAGLPCVIRHVYNYTMQLQSCFNTFYARIGIFNYILFDNNILLSQLSRVIKYNDQTYG
jgi:hypothetical protein